MEENDINWLYGFMLADVELQHKRLGRPDSPARDGRPTYKHIADRRIAILLSQIGDLSRFSYSDKDVEPTHRGFKTPTEEDSTFGHALLQLMAVAAARGIDVEAGVRMAVTAIRERDWARREAQEGGIKGTVACWPYTHASIGKRLARRGDAIGPEQALVLEHARVQDTPLMLGGWADFIITEQGGTMSHAAIVCREANKPCIVGTGPIPWPSGTLVRIHADGRIEKVNE